MVIVMVYACEKKEEEEGFSLSLFCLIIRSSPKKKKKKKKKKKRGPFREGVPALTATPAVVAFTSFQLHFHKIPVIYSGYIINIIQNRKKRRKDEKKKKEEKEEEKEMEEGISVSGYISSRAPPGTSTRFPIQGPTRGRRSPLSKRMRPYMHILGPTCTYLALHAHTWPYDHAWFLLRTSP
ncbi:hypothetical protein M0802_010702 [Mischocyttarus mexicanus]|nr:hypothetical protein M0802_010702 [Mischocyttarus mexicanus]